MTKTKAYKKILKGLTDSEAIELLLTLELAVTNAQSRRIYYLTGEGE